MKQDNNESKTYSLSEAARALGCGLGRNKLYDLLKVHGIIMNDNTPAIAYVSKGYLQQHTKYYITKYNTFKQHHMTLVTDKGLNWLAEFVNEKFTKIEDAL